VIQLLPDRPGGKGDMQTAPTLHNRRALHSGLPERELTVHDIVHALSGRRRIVLGSVLLCLLIAMGAYIATPKQYSSTAIVQIGREQESRLSLDSSSPESSDALQDNISLQTQVGILASDSLALDVIQDLHLSATRDFNPRRNPFGFLVSLMPSWNRKASDLASAPDKEYGSDPQERLRVLRIFHKRLAITPLPGTRLLNISYVSSDPRIAEQVVNSLARQLQDFDFETRHDATERTGRYLLTQLSDVRQQSEELEAKLARVQRESGIVDLGGLDQQGRPQVYSAILDKLQQVTAAYNQAEENLIAKKAIHHAAQTGEPEALASLVGSSPMFTGVASNGSLTLIQNLRLEQATLQGQLAETSAKFGPAYPKLEEMRQRLQAIDLSIQTEIARVKERAEADLLVAEGVEKQTGEVYTQLKKQADAVNDKVFAFTILQQEVNQSRALYDTLLKQLKETGILADFRASNISLVDPGRVPGAPAKPELMLYMGAGVGVGLILGCLIVLIQNVFDNRIQSLTDLDATLGRLPMGVIPLYQQVRPKTPLSGPHMQDAVLRHQMEKDAVSIVRKLAVVKHPRAPFAEALRALRTSLIPIDPIGGSRVVLVTSCLPSEGKTMLSLNLAYLLASQRAGKVLLVEGDLRRPIFESRFGIYADVGLSRFLEGSKECKEMKPTQLPHEVASGLFVVPAGVVPTNPAELLAGKRMADALAVWKEEFAFIIIDGTPVLPVTDSVLLSRYADVVLLITRYKMTTRPALERAYQLLQLQGARDIGVVVNAVDRTAEAYCQYYGAETSPYYEARNNA
jgi:polysaccharide biosynthesis transport protein